MEKLAGTVCKLGLTSGFILPSQRIKHQEDEWFSRLLILQPVPLLLWVVMKVIDLDYSARENSICCFQVLRLDRTRIAQGQWPVFEDGIERSPGAMNVSAIWRRDLLHSLHNTYLILVVASKVQLLFLFRKMFHDNHLC